ncbi:MAG: rod shape-determining protein MreC [Candidatus Pacebacteria bacterium]|nr:rod shape-determining protein MreC [Candidatus Paceibacterota bacterium]
MVYLSKPHRKITVKKKVLSLVVLLLLILSFYFGKLSFLANSIQFVSYPFFEIKNGLFLFVEDITSFFEFKTNLVKENSFLKQELWDINIELINKNLILAENKELKELLGMKIDDRKFILANVISKPKISLYDSFILDIGESDKVKKGDRVLAGTNVVIGEIEEVYSNSSKVKLYSYFQDELNVAIGFNKIISEAKGKGGGVFEIKLPQGIKVNKGDMITFPEMDLIILGKVEEIITYPEDPFQSILFKSPVNVFELRWVQILQE